MNDDESRDQLTEALVAHLAKIRLLRDTDRETARVFADVLLPTVQRIADQRAADELDVARCEYRERLQRAGASDVLRYFAFLSDRAAAIRTARISREACNRDVDARRQGR